VLAFVLHPANYPISKFMTMAQPYRCISPAEAVALLAGEEKPSIFDVRDLESYRLGHLADAVHLSESRLAAWFGRLAKDQPVLIYCYKGHASQSYAQMFADFRFTRVFSVDGGYAPLAAALGQA
jgi:rhodanese-related sulfurtransferase